MEAWNAPVGNMPTETVIYIREDGISSLCELMIRGMPWTLFGILIFGTIVLCSVFITCYQFKNSRK